MSENNDIYNLINQQANSLSTISVIVRGSNNTTYVDTVYSAKDDLVDSIIFSLSGVDRLTDIQNKLTEYEAIHKMKSNDFYIRWKSDPSMDKTELNKWASTYRFLQDVKN